MARTVRLDEIAYARSGDKGDDANVGIWAKSDAAYAVMRDVLTTDRVKQHFAAVCEGRVTRYELPNLRALNFVIVGLLGEGVASSLRPDGQAKSLGEWLRARVVELPESLLQSSGS